MVTCLIKSMDTAKDRVEVMIWRQWNHPGARAHASYKGIITVHKTIQCYVSHPGPFLLYKSNSNAQATVQGRGSIREERHKSKLRSKQPEWPGRNFMCFFAIFVVICGRLEIPSCSRKTFGFRFRTLGASSAGSHFPEWGGEQASRADTEILQ